MITGEGASRQREELKSLIFSNAERSSFSETVQGSSEGGEVDQAWLCSATSVPTLTERWNKVTEKIDCVHQFTLQKGGNGENGTSNKYGWRRP